MRYTPLYAKHARDASTVINLKGFARAMEYRGHLVEHRAVRERAGLCDVSHMGEIEFRGRDALRLVQKLITNDASRLNVNQALYSVMCEDNGGVIDDLVCFRLADDHFIWVVNVTKTDEDYQWVLRHAIGMDVVVRNISSDTALMALQGPESREILQKITKADLTDLQYYWLTQTTIHTAHAEVPCIISRTGYTGERGYEIMVARDLAPWVWDELLLVGRPLGIEPAGVAARESLRTEASYLLNGNDMDRATNPFEAGLGWAVKFTKEFVGRSALEAIKKTGVSKKLVGLEVQGPITIRHGYALLHKESQVGQVTSGPLWNQESQECTFGLGYVKAALAEPGTQLEVGFRGRRIPVRVVALPLRARRVKDEPQVRTYSPYDLRYSPAHVWAHIDDPNGSVATLGLSDFSQRMLGAILCAELPRVGRAVKKGAGIGWLDSYRKAAEVASPVAGEVVAVNEGLARNPALLNAYPYNRKGIVKIRVSSAQDLNAMLGFADYSAWIGRLNRYDEWTSELRTF